MGRKTTLWIFQATNEQNVTREDLVMAKNEKPLEGNWISSNSSQKPCHKDMLKQNW